MNLGTLNAAVLTSVGLAEIDKTIYAFSIPMAFDDYDEVYYVIDKMRPRFEANLLKKGYVVLNWADGGWVQFFAKKPVTTPDDLRKLKLFQWAGDQPLLKIWQSAGFNPVAAAVDGAGDRPPDRPRSRRSARRRRWRSSRGTTRTPST